MRSDDTLEGFARLLATLLALGMGWIVMSVFFGVSYGIAVRAARWVM